MPRPDADQVTALEGHVLDVDVQLVAARSAPFDCHGHNGSSWSCLQLCVPFSAMTLTRADMHVCHCCGKAAAGGRAGWRSVAARSKLQGIAQSETSPILRRGLAGGGMVGLVMALIPWRPGWKARGLGRPLLWP